MAIAELKTAAKDYPDHGIKKGEQYYSWKFRHGKTQRSKTKPGPAQLTQSAFKQAMYGLQDKINALSFVTEVDELSGAAEEIKEALQSQIDEAQGSLDNVPESLQSSHTLNTRVEMLQTALDEIEGMDFDYEEPSEDYDGDKADHLQEWINEKVSEVQDVSLEF